jgi:hypothetical protein
MTSRATSAYGLLQLLRECTALYCVAALLCGAGLPASAAQSGSSGVQATEPAAKLPPEQLDSLVAPIALYPDPMLSQVLIGSTYPLEIIQLQQWLAQNKNLKDKTLADAVAKQDWDPAIQGLAGLPEIVKLLSENIKWTTDLGNAFLAQQDDVMAAVQRMRKKAQSNGNLKSSEQQKVEVKTVESKQVIVIEQASPEVVYVPSYNPTVVYGAPVYAYPPIAYPPPGYYAAGMAISFGVGVAMGAMWGGGWCCGSSWHGGNNNVTINNNNNFNRQNYNRQNVSGKRPANQPARGGSNGWQHNPQHRGGAPYSDRNLANKYGGTARGDSLGNRQANARQRQNSGLGDRGGVGNRQQGGLGDRGTAGTRDASNRMSGGNSSFGGSRGGGDRVGNRSVPNTPSATNRSAFGGASSGMSGRDARASSSRGASSLGGSRGSGGFSGGGGGGRRGGGGGGRRR